MATEETEPVALWADEMIEAEAKRAFPDELTKEEIQDSTGIGPGDLRAVLERMLGAGSLREGDEGYLYVDPLDREKAAEADEDEVEGEDQPAHVEGPEEAGGDAVPALEGIYRASILVEVEYQPELKDGEDDPDEAALREARNDLRIAAANGVLADFPDLAVKPSVLRVQAFDKPRQVYP